MSAALVARALANPASTMRFETDSWTALICAARAERLLASLAHRLAGLDLPPDVARILESACRDAEASRMQALWEAEMARRALAPLDIPVVLLKGTAFVAAGLAAGQGRLIGDLDILIPRDRLADAETALLAAGWEWVKPDPYDDRYYRQWMHELPPLIHRERDRMIDVHHTILPLTARPKPDAAALIENSVALGNGLRVLSPEDMIVHAAAHLFADGDLSGGLRNLWDIHRLLDEFGAQPDFWGQLEAHAHRHALAAAVACSARLSAAAFKTEVPDRYRQLSIHGRPFRARLLARDGWGRPTQRWLRFGFYVRSHLLRMPLPLLLRHLWIKWRKGLEAR